MSIKRISLLAALSLSFTFFGCDSNTSSSPKFKSAEPWAVVSKQPAALSLTVPRPAQALDEEAPPNPDVTRLKRIQVTLGEASMDMRALALAANKIRPFVFGGIHALRNMENLDPLGSCIRSETLAVTFVDLVNQFAMDAESMCEKATLVKPIQTAMVKLGSTVTDSTLFNAVGKLQHLSGVLQKAFHVCISSLDEGVMEAKEEEEKEVALVAADLFEKADEAVADLDPLLVAAQALIEQVKTAFDDYKAEGGQDCTERPRRVRNVL